MHAARILSKASRNDKTLHLRVLHVSSKNTRDQVARILNNSHAGQVTTSQEDWSRKNVPRHEWGGTKKSLGNQKKSSSSSSRERERERDSRKPGLLESYGNFRLIQSSRINTRWLPAPKQPCLLLLPVARLRHRDVVNKSCWLLLLQVATTANSCTSAWKKHPSINLNSRLVGFDFPLSVASRSGNNT